MEDDRAAATEEPRLASRLPADLKPRLIAGVVLAVLAAGAAWAGSSLFALLVLAIALLMSWEWARVVRGGAIDATLVVHAASVVMAVALGANGLAALGLSAVLAGTFIVIALELGEHALLSAAGVLYTGLPSVALLWFRGGEPWGLWAILFLFAVVWSTDTVAYVSGRLIGGPKLLPKVSPNKTWAGFIGGVSAAALAGSLFHIPTGSSPFILGLIGLGLGVVSQAGDLAESALKRAFGVKDASALIPGHGGFMDRADGIVAAAVVAALLALFLDPEAPAQALLVHPR